MAALTMMSKGDAIIDNYISVLKTRIETIEIYLRHSLIPSICALAQIAITLLLVINLAKPLFYLLLLEIAVVLIGTTIYAKFFTALAQKRFVTDGKMLARASLSQRKATQIWFGGSGPIWFLSRLKDIKSVSLARERLASAEVMYHSGITAWLGLSVAISYYLLTIVYNLPNSIFVSFVLYSGLVIGPIVRISSFIPETKEAKLAFNSISQFGEEKRTKKSALGDAEQEILLIRNVFNINMQPNPFILKRMDRAAIIGKSGAGKTSLIEAVLGIRQGFADEIRILGVNPQKIAASMRSLKVFYMTETPVFEEGTILSNCTHSLMSCLEANKDLQLFDFPSNLEASIFFDRWIEQNGEPLSLGERQRLQLIRIFLQKPKVLLMDECLSGVDEAMEKNVIQKLMKMPDLELIVYVGHRKSIQELFDNKITLGEYSPN